MKVIKANFNKSFTLRDKDGQVYTQEFIVGDEYTEDEFTPDMFEILSNYLTQSQNVFSVGEIIEESKEEYIENKVIAQKKEESIIPVSLQEEFFINFGQEVPRNKVNDEKWIKEKIKNK